mgnify:CR=1 FL=1
MKGFVVKHINHFIAILLLCASITAQAQVTTSPNYTALWWNPAESGWGMNLTHQGSIMFSTVFTYRNDQPTTTNPPTWFVMTPSRSCRWPPPI